MDGGGVDDWRRYKRFEDNILVILCGKLPTRQVQIRREVIAAIK